MLIHHCDTCGRNYTLKRNLRRHVLEKHSKDYEHWNCVEPDCAKTFIWRTTLAYHLRTIHGYTQIRAGEFSLRALRGDVQANSYYENISDDDSVFDVINDIQEMRNVGVDGDIPLDDIDIPLDYIQDDILLHCDDEEKDDSTENGEVVKADNEESVTLVVVKKKMTVLKIVKWSKLTIKKPLHLVMVKEERFLLLYVTLILMG